ncbi:GNAT family N-acetyltransferase [Zhihengliuella sp. ISTPL4]|uniref:GNAT family N-acetyltransferase n=1 Tax=Zhihengliuella sp. ISTPL4 TaxID=2058657 RepID=UPI000C7AE920|nr:GNAT family N-acetyltransferase [Zhihengliuella sp. ISTPL4]
MSIVIERVTVATPEIAAFIGAHHAEMDGTAPPESQHALPLDRLLAPRVRFFTGVLEGRIAATGALAAVEGEHEELKSMRTDPAFRGRGFGRAMLRHLLDDAAARGIRRVSLETGRDAFFAPARAMYAAAGFREGLPFGSYLPDPHSAFLTLALPPASAAAPSRAIMNG